jgi:hypothetical protein
MSDQRINLHTESITLVLSLLNDLPPCEMMHLSMPCLRLGEHLILLILSTNGIGRDNRQEGHNPEKQGVRRRDI